MDTNKVPPAPSQSSGNDVEQNKVLAAVSYLWIISLIVLLVKKDSAFAQYHAKQGLVIFIASLVLGFIPIIGWLLSFLLFFVALYGLISALQGKWTKIPGVSDLAKKINF